MDESKCASFGSLSVWLPPLVVSDLLCSSLMLPFPQRLAVLSHLASAIDFGTPNPRSSTENQNQIEIQ